MPIRIRPLILGVSAAVASPLLMGCSTAPQSDLRLTSTNSGQLYAQAFPAGVADVNDAGDADLIVACDTGAAAPGVPAVRQVLHVRVLWQQGHRIKSPMREVSRNAALHWYVYPAGQTDAAGGQQVVEYAGTGLVEMARDGDRVTVRVLQADLRPTTVTGRMADPVGPSTLTGTLVARQDRPAAAVRLADLRATVAAARQEAGAAEARLPLGQ